MKKIAVFASGAGTNTATIIDHFSTSPSQPPSPMEREGLTPTVEIALIVCNNPKAGVLSIAAQKNIPSLVIDKERFFRGDAYLSLLKENEIDLIVLAGFLWKIPDSLIKEFPRRIINIHPALLPKFGGKGMYGDHVHNAVITNNEKQSGITIHYVDEHYDNGDIIFQAACPVTGSDTPGSLAKRIRQLEQEHYPRVIGELLSK
ncbi:MAG: phosphoribosylglycinamide formyltransferase [Chitinophagaceae bacterium]